LGTRSKIIHHCVPLPGPLTLLKVDTTSAFQHLTAKPREIECCAPFKSTAMTFVARSSAHVFQSP
jgi:hypothetical protein